MTKLVQKQLDDFADYVAVFSEQINAKTKELAEEVTVLDELRRIYPHDPKKYTWQGWFLNSLPETARYARSCILQEAIALMPYIKTTAELQQIRQIVTQYPWMHLPEELGENYAIQTTLKKPNFLIETQEITRYTNTSFPNKKLLASWDDNIEDPEKRKTNPSMAAFYQLCDAKQRGLPDETPGSEDTYQSFLANPKPQDYVTVKHSISKRIDQYIKKFEINHSECHYALDSTKEPQPQEKPSVDAIAELKIHCEAYTQLRNSELAATKTNWFGKRYNSIFAIGTKFRDGNFKIEALEKFLKLVEYDKTSKKTKLPAELELSDEHIKALTEPGSRTAQILQQYKDNDGKMPNIFYTHGLNAYPCYTR